MPRNILIKANSPNYLWFSDKPLRLGGNPIKLQKRDLQDKFNFEYSENISISDDNSSHKFGHDDIYGAEWLRICEYLNNPIHDKLVICFINEKVGHGVFAKEPIKAGTIVALYSGEIIQRSNSYRSDYGMVINEGEENNFAIDAKNIGGIARFIQHMPFSTKRIINFIKTSDMKSFFPRLRSNGVLEKNEMEILQKVNNIELLIQEGGYCEKIEELNSEFNEEIESITFLDEVENKLAVANVKQFSFCYNQMPILYFETCMDIEAGEQLGITYNKKYWSQRNILPELFKLDGSIIPQNKYNRSGSQEKSVQNTSHAADHLFKGMFSDPKVKLKSAMIKKYQLANDSISELEKGLRKAARNNQFDDIPIFVNLGVNINAQDSVGEKRTALHHAVLQKSFKCTQELLKQGARYDICDIHTKSALKYATELNNMEILNLFPALCSGSLNAQGR